MILQTDPANLFDRLQPRIQAIPKLLGVVSDWLVWLLRSPLLYVIVGVWIGTYLIYSFFPSPSEDDDLCNEQSQDEPPTAPARVQTPKVLTTAQRRHDIAQMAWDYVKTWTPIAFFLAFVIIAIRHEEWRNFLIDADWSKQAKDTFVLYYPMIVLMFSSLGVIAYVCIDWQFELDNLKYDDHNPCHQTKKKQNHRVTLERYKNFSRVLCVACSLAAVAFIGYILCASMNAHQSWDDLTECNEAYSFLIFLVFVVIDACVWRASLHTTDKLSKKLGHLALETICIVDAPCVIGVGFVMCLHHILHYGGDSNVLFRAGCSAGAVAIHVAITQSAFAVMKTREIHHSTA